MAKVPPQREIDTFLTTGQFRIEYVLAGPVQKEGVVVKVEPMVRGLFPGKEQDPVRALLERSLLFPACAGSTSPVRRI